MEEKEIVKEEVTNGGGVFLKGLLVGRISRSSGRYSVGSRPGKELRADIKEKGNAALKMQREFNEDSRTRAKAALEACKTPR